ncbi:MAG: hypothetical protein ACJ8AW_34270 [Rhodopila sp.]
MAGLLARRASRQGTLVLFSTHDAAQALTIATPVLVMAEEPTTLQADLAVPVLGDVGARQAMLAGLTSRFAFLASGAA